jgi:hypothetical protein
MRVVPRTMRGEAGSSAPNYNDLAREPAHRRKSAVGDGLRAPEVESDDMLDIPAFLRRQAD